MVLLRCKVVVAGEPTVGKTALIQSFNSNGQNFPKNYTMTTGIDFSVKAIPIPDTKTSVELHLFDCGGQSIFQSLTQSAYDKVNMIMLVYDITNADSFRALEKWLNDVRGTRREPLFGVLVANKTDMQEDSAVPSEQGQEFAQTHGLEFFECSAMRGHNLEAPFSHLAQLFHRSYEDKLEMLSTL
eukprot:GILJ01002223.1.p1 GENE.GILJ01002223.1~~GILJ01002223.1.p1  ORF type:complete len:185 (+),score=27.35 GILJ01002223.1:49-603(+)